MEWATLVVLGVSFSRAFRRCASVLEKGAEHFVVQVELFGYVSAGFPVHCGVYVAHFGQ
jgi:hypothetical protein